MANYLPVLLVSVAANSIPDDSSVSTLPRGQVDYLSHNWQEEDVWRSWRNMTRQKNEIANGVRLENASWRTWWKQRNGLGTVTPETLNWLKDSDVTWLYGPLHTAVDWAPPPKSSQANGHTALDLSTSVTPTHKPILKHRSISQLLTSDFPTSPIYSPAESDDDGSYFSNHHSQVLDESDASQPRRPTLTHTKSDTHIVRWGPSRAFRKDSPPRIDPPAHLPQGADATTSNNAEDYFVNPTHGSDSNSTPAISQGSGHGQKKRHISFNTFVEQCIAIEKPKSRSTCAEDDEADGDSEEEVQGDEEDEYVDRGLAGRYPYGRNAWGYDDGYEEDEDEDSEDEAEAVSMSMWDERYSGLRRAVSGSDSDSYDYDEGVGEEDGANEEEEGDGMIEMRSPFSTRTKPTSPRSQSTVSTASSSSSASTSTSMSNSTSSTSDSLDGRNPLKPTSQRRLSTSTTSTYRPSVHHPSTASSGSSSRRFHRAPPLIRTTTAERRGTTSPPPQPTHVTIAPIAPTILKTGSHGYYGHHPGGWVEGFGDEGGSDDGLWGGGAPKWWSAGLQKGKGKGASEESDGSGGQTPVELVYVPPFGSNYSFRTGRDRDREREQKIFTREKGWERRREREIDGGREGIRNGKVATKDVMEDHEDGFGNGDHDVYRRRATLFSVGDNEPDADGDDAEPIIAVGPGIHMGAPVPTVVIRHDAYSDFGGGGLPLRRHSSSSLVRSNDVESFRPRGEVERARSKSRSRSRSRSRTPSPALMSTSTTSPIAGASSIPLQGKAPVPVPLYRSSSASPTYEAAASPALLSPPPRGRGSHSYQDLGQAPQRGRSSARTSSSLSDRDRSTHSSSLGSLSPEGAELGNVAGAYTGGRLDRERERERGKSGGERERSRGRERSDNKKLSQSQNVSPDAVQDSLLRVSPASAAPLQLPASVEDRALRLALPIKASTSSVSSSSSSCSTSSSTTVVPTVKYVANGGLPVTAASVPIDVRRAEEKQRHLQPTPSNSPIIIMQAMPAAVVAATTSSSYAPSAQNPAQAEFSLSTIQSVPTYTKSPLTVPAPHPAQPSTSYSISPPRGEHSAPSSPTSPRSPVRGESTIVGKAVDIVSSAGAFLGLWNHSM